MVKKKLVLSKGVLPLALLLVVSGCSSAKKKKPDAPISFPTTVNDPTEPAPQDASPPPPAIVTENLAPPEAPAAPPMPTLKDVQIAAYIDAVGYDAFTALGFMQEFEKTGIKPVKMVGTGFGCWVAVSWALENSGNRAEWQSFKWTKWDTLPQKGFLNRLKGAIGAEDRFTSEIDKLMTDTRFEKLQLPADCPNLENQGSFTLRSSRSGDIPHALWTELLHPALGVPEGYYDNEKQVSGIFAGFPTDDEWDDLSRDSPGGSQPMLWLYLRTRTADERKTGVENLQILGLRQETNQTAIHRTAHGNYFMIVDLTGPKRNLDSLKNTASRRKFLLDGRKKGRQILEAKTIEKAFSELFVPATTPDSGLPPLATPPANPATVPANGVNPEVSPPEATAPGAAAPGAPGGTSGPANATVTPSTPAASTPQN